MTEAGFFIPRIQFLVAVVVSAITCTFSISKLLTSPIVFNVAKKSISPASNKSIVTQLTVKHEDSYYFKLQN